MYSYISGEVTQTSENTVVLDVGGIGYELCVSSFTQEKCQVGQRCRLYAYLQVKEDGIALYGFGTEEEKAMFLKLITVTGIGPKMAITILSGMKLSDLVVSILNEDANSLSKIKGLGKKGAERICLELKDKVSTTSLSLDDMASVMTGEQYNETALNDAVETLINLGVNKNEAYRLARSKVTPEITAEEIILKVLRELGR